MMSESFSPFSEVLHSMPAETNTADVFVDYDIRLWPTMSWPQIQTRSQRFWTRAAWSVPMNPLLLALEPGHYRGYAPDRGPGPRTQSSALL